MKNKGILAFLTLLMVVLAIAGVALVLSLRKESTDVGTVPVAGSLPYIEVGTTIDYIRNNADGSVEVKYIYTLKNISPTHNIISLTAQSDLEKTFSPHVFSILEFASSTLKLNPSYNGVSNKELLAPGNKIEIGQTLQISLVINFFPEGDTGPFDNNITASGDIQLPPRLTTTGTTGGSGSGSGGSTNTPPSTTTSGSTTEGTTGTTTGGDTRGGVTSGIPTEPSPPPPGSTGGSSSSTSSTPPASTGGGVSGGSVGITSGSTTSGGDPEVIGGAQVSFTLTPSGGAGTITQVQLPSTSVLPFHFGLLSNFSEWVKDNIIHEDRNKLTIDNIGVNGEVFEGDDSALDLGFWILPDSSTPELGGNTVIAGHRFTYNYGPYTFFNLNKLEKGDSINIKWEGKDYSYKVLEIKTVLSTDVSILNQSNKNILTLITCTSWDINEPRLVIQAELQ